MEDRITDALYSGEDKPAIDLLFGKKLINKYRPLVLARVYLYFIARSEIIESVVLLHMGKGMDIIYSLPVRSNGFVVVAL